MHEKHFETLDYRCLVLFIYDSKIIRFMVVYVFHTATELSYLTLKAPDTTIAIFANTADPDETAHNEPSHLDLQCLPSKVLFFNIKQFLLKVFRNFANVILSSAFLAFYDLRQFSSICRRTDKVCI